MDKHLVIKLLQAAVGPDRKLDESLFEYIHNRKRGISTFEQYEPSEILPEYTDDIRLPLKALDPKWTAWEIKSRGNKSRFIAEISREQSDGGEQYSVGYSPSPAIALWLAILRDGE